MSTEFTIHRAAIVALNQYVEQVHQVVAKATMREGKVVPALADQEQRILHGYAWIISTSTALKVLLSWAESLQEGGKFRTVEQLSLQIAFGEYLAQVVGGLAMGQNEVVRPADFGLSIQASDLANNSAVAELLNNGNTAETRRALAEQCRDGVFASENLGDDFIDAAREQYHRFTNERIIPHAHQWHLD
ncbi:MAG: hypothetical protein P8M77_10115, partial [Porticoccaceae bacterium]|nr:hypothetical protein [Porticoccaceae bacterium]